MLEQDLAFHVGDQVIHWAYGPGVIIQLDEKALFVNTSQYYVVKLRDLTLWVPISQSRQCCLRFPTPAKDFQKLFRILAEPGELLSSDRYERKAFLTERFKERSLESICLVIRDLTLRKRMKKMNDDDSTILERARNFLLNEWSLVLSVPVHQAELELKGLLDRGDTFDNRRLSLT